MEIDSLHSGETVFVLGCGPSMERVQIADLGRFVTIGVNRLPAIYDPDYLVVIDQRVIDVHGDLFGIRNTVKFCNEDLKTDDDLGLKSGELEENPALKCGACWGACRDEWIRFKRFWPEPDGSVMSERFADGLFFGYSSIFAAINLAVVMGAKRIILAGVDMNDNSHFFDKRGVQNPFPSFDVITRDFGRVKDFAGKRGIEIFNANPDSAVKWFPFIDIRGL